MKQSTNYIPLVRPDFSQYTTESSLGEAPLSPVVWDAVGLALGNDAQRNGQERTGCHLVALSQLSHAVEKMETYGWLLVFYPRKIF